MSPALRTELRRLALELRLTRHLLAELLDRLAERDGKRSR